jgi:hypothetical protein
MTNFAPNDGANFTDEQKEDFATCAKDFPHFVRQWVKIVHPVRGLIPFEVYGYQERLWKHYETNRFSILTKFRQGGFTTMTLLYAMWRCMFRLDQRILFLSKTDREAVYAKRILDRALQHLPDWLQPEVGKNNNHQIQFTYTNSDMAFLTPIASRGRGCSLLIIDEPAFIPNMEQHWKAMYPCIACGGNVIAVGTPNGLANWFQETYHAAQQGKNAFSVFFADYTEHPDYNNADWVKQVRENLGEAGWQQEILQNFLAPE